MRGSRAWGRRLLPQPLRSWLRLARIDAAPRKPGEPPSAPLFGLIRNLVDSAAAAKPPPSLSCTSSYSENRARNFLRVGRRDTRLLRRPRDEAPLEPQGGLGIDQPPIMTSPPPQTFHVIPMSRHTRMFSSPAVLAGCHPGDRATPAVRGQLRRRQVRRHILSLACCRR